MDDNKYLASLALFGELYNNKKNLYSVLAEFLKYAILTKSLYSFNPTEITNLLNEMYDFAVPEAVIKTTLKSLPFLEKKDGVYSVDKTKVKEKELEKFSSKFEQIKNNNNLFLAELIEFIKSSHKENQVEIDDGDIINSFCSYLINDDELGKYANLISAFVIRNKNNPDFIKRINIIKEGIILYYGIKYTSNLSELGSWKTKLIIYLETEILFSMAGYNGILFSILFNDLYQLIDEINKQNIRRGGGRLIYLKYFKETEDEINSFFYKAENIVRNKEIVNPARPAMVEIVNGCKAPSDVIEKKTKFLELLKKNLITVDDAVYYDSKYHKYNIEDSKTLEEIKECNPEISVGDIEKSLKLLNFINILRKGKGDEGFENIGYILLSGRNTTKQLSLGSVIKGNKEVPLATTIDWLTNRFWFRLNKGFGKEGYPKTFEVVTKAQIVLSTQISTSISRKFEELKRKMKTGEMTNDLAIANLVEFRESVFKPEEIDFSNVDQVLKEIKEEELIHFAQEKEAWKHNLKEMATGKEALEGKLIESQKTIDQRNNEIIKLKTFEEKYLRLQTLGQKIKKALLIVGILGVSVFIAWQIVLETLFGRIFAAIEIIIGVSFIFRNKIKKLLNSKK